jgi:glutathione S-transferase
MPTLTFKFIFGTIPERAPTLLKPFLRGIFDALNNRLTLPRLRIHADFVRTNSWLVLIAPTYDTAQMETHLNKSKSPWFVGGHEPTGADFMMSFPLELWYRDDPSLLGPKTQEFVRVLLER